MFAGSRYYALRDDGGSTGAIEVYDEGKLRGFNQRGYGIFCTVNAFAGQRLAANLRSINAWYCETDSRPKRDVMRDAALLPLIPSMVVESKNGLHMYWFASGATIENYRAIQETLAARLGGDNLKDVTRILRVPGYDHLKDPADPFRIREVYRDDERVYTEAAMLVSFDVQTAPTASNTTGWRELPRPVGSSWRQALVHAPVEAALMRLSGSEHVRGEMYDIVENGNGTAQIWIDGKKSSSWIDEEGKIGSWKRWGPSIYTWLHWYAREEGQTRYEALADALVTARVKEASEYLFGGTA